MTFKKKIKILFGLEAADGGALKHVIYLVLNLNYEIFDVTIMLSPRSIEAHAEIEKIKKRGIHVIILPMPREISFIKDVRVFFKIWHYLRTNNFDIVHSHSSKAGVYFRLASKLSNIPIILHTPHCFHFQSKSGLQKFFFIAIERFLARITDRCIVSSNEEQHFVENRIGSFHKLVNINNAINFRDYVKHDKHVMNELLGFSKASIVVGTICRIVKQKGLHMMIDVAQRIVTKYPGTIFIIAGTGEFSSLITEKINALGLQRKIVLLGHSEEVSKVYSAIDIFVNTSLWEGLPYALLEAMWYEKPIVAADLGYQGLLDNEFLIPNRDTDLFCDKVSTLIENKKLRQQVGERNKSTVEANLSFDVFVNKHENLYLNMFSKNV